MMPLMDEAADGLLTHLHKLSSQSDSVEIKESSAKFSTDAISSCAFGIKANCFEREDAELRLAAKSLFALDRMTGIRQASHMFLHPLAKIMRLPFFPRHTMQFLREVFWTAVEQREQTKTKRNDLIDLIIQIKNGNGEDKEVKFGMNNLEVPYVIYIYTRTEAQKITALIGPRINSRRRTDAGASF